MSSKLSGYEDLVRQVMEGKLDHIDAIYQCCENLWEGLNISFKELEIDYISEELPF